MEDFQRVGFLADAHEFDRHAGNRAHADRRAAARITIDLGQDQARQLHTIVETLGYIDGFLASHGVGYKQDLSWLRDRFDLLDDFLGGACNPHRLKHDSDERGYGLCSHDAVVRNK